MGHKAILCPQPERLPQHCLHQPLAFVSDVLAEDVGRHVKTLNATLSVFSVRTSPVDVDGVPKTTSTGRFGERPKVTKNGEYP